MITPRPCLSALNALTRLNWRQQAVRRRPSKAHRNDQQIRPFAFSSPRSDTDNEQDIDGTKPQDHVSSVGEHGDLLRHIDDTEGRRSALDELAGKGGAQEAQQLARSAEQHMKPIHKTPRATTSRLSSTGGGQTYWAGPLGDDYGEDDEFEEDDISTLGHGELEQHREMREFARTIAWEMPLLSKLAKPFHPPTQSTPLRYRTTDYMGTPHPAASKVVLEFCPSDLPLTPPQLSTLIKLCGPRYNPSTSIVKISCESFETAAQNKRYLSDRVSALLAEARDSADTFEDVPFDFRHARVKRRVRFPEEWKMTEERRGVLARRREERKEVARREEEGDVIDGLRVVEEGLALSAGREAVERQAVMVGGGGEKGTQSRRRRIVAKYP